tara:strand:+ start:157 stop:285 length:129 start_codon:yes stop_codon:yes gene_type:complete
MKRKKNTFKISAKKKRILEPSVIIKRNERNPEIKVKGIATII